MCSDVLRVLFDAKRLDRQIKKGMGLRELVHLKIVFFLNQDVVTWYLVMYANSAVHETNL